MVAVTSQPPPVPAVLEVHSLPVFAAVADPIPVQVHFAAAAVLLEQVLPIEAYPNPFAVEAFPTLPVVEVDRIAAAAAVAADIGHNSAAAAVHPNP
jgi:hypothetical protein